MGPRIDVCRRQRQKISKLCKLTGILVILGGTEQGLEVSVCLPLPKVCVS